MAAFAGVQNLRDRVVADDPGALKEVATQFEALVLNLMLKAARDAMPAEGAFDGTNTQQYLELMDRHVSLALARQGGLGLAKLLGGDAESTQVPRARAEMPASRPVDPASFVEQVLPHARSAAASLGIDPKLLVAQAALESGWGSALPSHPNGRSSFNLFGIKAGPSWAGETVSQRTLEYVDGIPERRWEQFRAYPDLAATFQDYVDLVQGAAAYRDASAAPATPESYVEALTRGGYATDPDYGNKWLAVYRGDRLQDAYAGAL